MAGREEGEERAQIKCTAEPGGALISFRFICLLSSPPYRFIIACWPSFAASSDFFEIVVVQEGRASRPKSRGAHKTSHRFNWYWTSIDSLSS